MNSKCLSIQRHFGHCTQFGAGAFLFKHDCPQEHEARSVKTWMVKSGMDEFDSPDFKPIKQVWDELKWRMRTRESHPRLLCYPKNALQEEWLNIPMNTHLNLVESHLTVVEAVVAKKRGPTSYSTPMNLEWDVT